jgi:hypothetical protein
LTGRRGALARAVIGLVCTFAAAAPQGQAAPGSVNYLPLDQGRRWVLRSPSAAKPIILEVVSAKGGVVGLKFDNPWILSELQLSR